MHICIVFLRSCPWRKVSSRDATVQILILVQTLLLFTKPHFQTFNALKSTSFQAFQIISDAFSQTLSLYPWSSQGPIKNVHVLVKVCVCVCVCLFVCIFVYSSLFLFASLIFSQSKNKHCILYLNGNFYNYFIHILPFNGTQLQCIQSILYTVQMSFICTKRRWHYFPKCYKNICTSWLEVNVILGIQNKFGNISMM